MSIKNKIGSRGFSILEMAIVVTVVGVLITPVIAMYHQHRVEKNWEEVEDEVYDIANEIGGYRAVYGRYPCPSPTTAIPGDVEYGHEFASDCSASAPAAGSCVNGICTSLNATSGKLVVIGSLPYKILNLQEPQAYDSRHNRYTYAVTLDLTDNTLFDLAGGGIGVVEKDDMSISLVSPPSTAHFVLLSHGDNGAGGISRSGAAGNPCSSGSASEQENCDNDAIFASGNFDKNDFDDRVSYFSPVSPSEWQVSANDNNAIHLKNTDSIAIGANMSNNLSSASQATIMQLTTDTGSVKSTTKFKSERICRNTSTNRCFEPELIAGTLNMGAVRKEAETNSEGISCYKPSLGEDGYMIGIANNDIICSDEIFITCPNGNYIDGIDASGNVKCNTYPLARCLETSKTTTCGKPATIAETYSSSYSVAYSGECRMIEAHDATWFKTKIAAMSNESEVATLISNLNGTARTVGDCGSGYNDPNTLVRDAYLCTNGSWSHARAHERLYNWYTFPTDLITTSGDRPAETSYMGGDISNNNNYHDCWCREDYRATDIPCLGYTTGTGVKIEKHICPQTTHEWTEITTSYELCACSDQYVSQYPSCNSYYDEINGTTGTTGLSGYVEKKFHLTCDADGNTVYPSTPESVDTTGCACSPEPQTVNKTYCPDKTTNSWDWMSIPQTGVKTLSTQDWICPSTTSGGLPDPGFWTAPTPYSPIPACECNDSYKEDYTESCPSGQQGSGIVYEKEWDCATGSFEDKSLWAIINSDCHGCSWKAPSGTPTTEEFKYGDEVGGSCSCGSASTTQCWSYSGGSGYSVWTSCPCIVNP